METAEGQPVERTEGNRDERVLLKTLGLVLGLDDGSTDCLALGATEATSVGRSEGAGEGMALRGTLGSLLGLKEGSGEGSTEDVVVGNPDGTMVGCRLAVGRSVSRTKRLSAGVWDGAREGPPVLGVSVGLWDSEGSADGAIEGCRKILSPRVCVGS